LALAMAQPLFDHISKNPDFLAARRLIGVVFDEVSTIAFKDARERIDQVLCPTWRRWRGTAPGSDTRRR
jgi:hypothetical protein